MFLARRALVRAEVGNPRGTPMTGTPGGHGHRRHHAEVAIPNHAQTSVIPAELANALEASQ